jgi:hypothetical protein
LGDPLINPGISPDRVYFATFDTKGNFWFSTGGGIQEIVGVVTKGGRGPSGAFTRPGRPTHVSVLQYANTATIHFVAGTEGNLPTHYMVTAFRDGRSAGIVCNLSTSRRCVVASLVASRSYTFVVTAVDVLGRRASTTSAPVRFLVPNGNRPQEVNLHIVQGSSSTVALHWTSVVKTLKSPIIGYECNGGTSRSVVVTTTHCVLPRGTVSRHGGFVVLSVVAIDADHRLSAPALLDIKLS